MTRLSMQGRRGAWALTLGISVLAAGLTAAVLFGPAAAPSGATAGAGTPLTATPACLQGDGYVEDGEIPTAVRPPGDAQGVLGFRFAGHFEAGELVCERLVVDLGTADGAPAQTGGNVTAELLRDQGIVRIHLEGYDRADLIDSVKDAALGGAWIDSAYLVLSHEGAAYIDVHLSGAALARVFVLDEPGRIVIDARPGGDPLPPPAATANNIVLLEPRPRATDTYPLTIRGYARTFESNVIARVYVDGVVHAQQVTTAASWVEAWGEFEITIERGPDGPIELFVGEESAADGSELGVRVDVVTAQ